MFKLLLPLLVVLVGFSAKAEDKSEGCGLGWKVTSRTSLSGTSTRGTTNSGGVSSIFGTSFGTSGCDKHGLVKNEKQAIHFAEANYDNLLLEMATGSGEFLEGFAVTLGCNPQSFGSAMQKNYLQIIQSGNSAGPLLNKVNAIISTDSSLASQCSPLLI
jgi:hypothetical protein